MIYSVFVERGWLECQLKLLADFPPTQLPPIQSFSSQSSMSTNWLASSWSLWSILVWTSEREVQGNNSVCEWSQREDNLVRAWRRLGRTQISCSFKIASFSHLVLRVGEGASKQITIFSIKGLEISFTSSFQFQMSINLISGKINRITSPLPANFVCGAKTLSNIKVTYLPPHASPLSTFNSKLNSKDASGFGSKGQWTFVNWFHWKEFDPLSDIYSLCIS